MEKEIRLTVHVNAAPEAVWDALTNPAKIAQYMYGAIARTDWQPAAPFITTSPKTGRKSWW
jgi:uncharacterized protein YndB with AHSA1/START domain